MSVDLPAHYFRIRETGAAAYRVDTENRERRLELIEIAFINLKTGNIRPHGEYRLTQADEAAIATWLRDRRQLQERRDLDDAERLIEQMNNTAHWAQSRANAADLAAISDRLFLAMHDLRSVLVRKKAERLGNDTAAQQ